MVFCYHYHKYLHILFLLLGSCVVALTRETPSLSFLAYPIFLCGIGFPEETFLDI